MGRSPRTPKSPTVRTRPSPKWCCQTRLTITRDRSDPAPWSTSVIQSASARRWPVLRSDAISRRAAFQYSSGAFAPVSTVRKPTCKGSFFA